MFVEPKKAKSILNEAYTHNPGPWRDHSLNVAIAAMSIAKRTEKLNPEKAYSLGLLHDIGRIKGVTSMRHIYDGYMYLSKLGFDENAKVCLTHSFPIRIIESYNGANDCTPQEVSFIADYIISCEYNDYDRLIQLCDAIALPTGICILEKRLFDVALRNGVNEYTVDKWKAFIGLKEYFDNVIHCDVYGLFENT